MPLANNGYLLGGFIGLIDRGYVGWKKLRTEVAFLTFGNAGIACVPGEIYPELVNGGVEKPVGADFRDGDANVRSLRHFMTGSPKFVFGLANDEIGYILPKSQWDEKPPYAYGATGRPYGEINSVGPDVAPVIMGALEAMCDSQPQAERARPTPASMP